MTRRMWPVLVGGRGDGSPAPPPDFRHSQFIHTWEPPLAVGDPYAPHAIPEQGPEFEQTIYRPELLRGPGGSDMVVTVWLADDKDAAARRVWEAMVEATTVPMT